MNSAKDLILKPIPAAMANDFTRTHHYSGKHVRNSQFHVGVYLQGSLEGVLQFGMCLDKSKMLGLVKGTGWNNFLELNRMVFTDKLPKNSESRAISIALRLLKKYAPHVKWVISFADATQCGDGTIYRASGFVLTAIKPNTQLWQMPQPDKIKELAIYNPLDIRWRALVSYSIKFNSIHTMYIQGGDRVSNQQSLIKSLYRELLSGKQSMSEFMGIIGGKPFKGFQLRYIYFLDPSYRERLTVPILPFSKIEEMGASMYKGKSIIRAGSVGSDTLPVQGKEGGAVPTSALTEDFINA